MPQKIKNQDCCVIDGEIKIRSIYVYEDCPNKVCYVGLAKNVHKRHLSHLRKLHKTTKYDTVMSYFLEKYGYLPEPKVLESGLSREEAQEQEDYWRRKYEENGWITLNKAKTGRGSSSLGAMSIKWTKEKVLKTLSTCKTRKELHANFSAAFARIKEYDINLEEYIPRVCDINKCSFEELKKIANEYSTMQEWKEKDSHTYNMAYKNNWLRDLFKDERSEIEYTKESLLELSKKYHSFMEFSEKEMFALRYAENHGMLEFLREIYKETIRTYEQIWTKENVFAEASKYKSRTEFNRNSYQTYDTARRYGWLDELFGEFTRKKYYTDDELINFLKEQPDRASANRKSYTKFKEAKNRGLLDKYLPKKKRKA